MLIDYICYRLFSQSVTMTVMVYIFLALIFYSIAMLFGIASARNANTNLAAAITNFVSAIIPIAVVIPIVSKKMVGQQKFGILMAALGGASIALFVMSVNKAYSLNKVGIVTPIVFGGSIMLVTVASYFLFKEKISSLQLFGLALLAAGFVVIIYARATGK